MKTKRVGPRMEAVVARVRWCPGARPADVARAVGPHGSLRFGYAAIRRAIAAGLVVKRPDPAHSRWGQLFLAEGVAR